MIGKVMVLQNYYVKRICALSPGVSKIEKDFAALVLLQKHQFKQLIPGQKYLNKSYGKPG